jgi:hypothetical protein
MALPGIAFRILVRTSVRARHPRERGRQLLPRVIARRTERSEGRRGNLLNGEIATAPRRRDKR